FDAPLPPSGDPRVPPRIPRVQGGSSGAAGRRRRSRRSRRIAASGCWTRTTPCDSTPASSGATRPNRTPWYTSISTSVTSSRPDEMSDDHGHHPQPLSDAERRARALEDLLTEKGVVTGEFIDRVVEAYAQDVGPMNGAKVVARAWVDPDYKERLLADGTAAIAELGFGGPEGDHLVAVE